MPISASRRPICERFLIVGALFVAVSACSKNVQQAAPSVEVGAPASANHAVVVGKAPPRALVTLESVAARALPPSTEFGSMDQFSRAFYPELLIVRAGQEVRFSNSENELHSVRINAGDTKAIVYNVVLPGMSLQKHVFDKPGFYDVTCDFHSEMRAWIYVSSTPYAVVAGEDGTSRFPRWNEVRTH